MMAARCQLPDERRGYARYAAIGPCVFTVRRDVEDSQGNRAMLFCVRLDYTRSERTMHMSSLSGGIPDANSVTSRRARLRARCHPRWSDLPECAAQSVHLRRLPGHRRKPGDGRPWESWRPHRARRDAADRRDFLCDRSAVFGSGPFGFHLTSVLLHMINVGLIGLLAWRAAEDYRRRSPGPRLRGASRDGRAGRVALLRCIRCWRARSGYISARPEVLCATFVLLALLAARRWMTGRGGLGGRHGRALADRACDEGDSGCISHRGLAYDRWIVEPAAVRSSVTVCCGCTRR